MGQAPAVTAGARIQDFAARVIGWQRRHGRHGLPWQGSRDPYRVWLAEIMLQQTQAVAVVPYYLRFLQRFPDLHALSESGMDEVLAAWSGLGYYQRARNLHACARTVMECHGGMFPRTASELELLPGIGRSTAAAIAAFCFGERAAILDGNVRRVLARVFGVTSDLRRPRELRALWDLAGTLLPAAELPDAMPAYTQGMMDLGALVCLPRAPRCAACPLRDVCVAAARGDPQRYPARPVPPERRILPLWLLHAQDAAGRSWLVRRPARGIWGRLYCLPAFASREQLASVLPSAERRQLHWQPVREHGLTHRVLQLHIARVDLRGESPPAIVGGWYGATEWGPLGLPAPIRRYLAGQAHGAA